MLNNLVQLTLLGPEREAQADEYAMRLCLRAGYHRDRCQDVFEILEANYLDHQDLDEVFGPDKPATERPFLPGIRRHGAFDPRGVLSRVTAWGQERGRVHPPIRIRIETLKKRFPT